MKPYILLSSYTSKDLSEKVSKHIFEGYLPFGAPFIRNEANPHTEMPALLCQAVVLKHISENINAKREKSIHTIL